MLSSTASISAERRPDGVTHYCAPCVAGHSLSKLTSHNLLKLKCKYSQAQAVPWYSLVIFLHLQTNLKAPPTSWRRHKVVRWLYHCKNLRKGHIAKLLWRMLTVSLGL